MVGSILFPLATHPYQELISKGRQESQGHSSLTPTQQLPKHSVRYRDPSLFISSTRVGWAEAEDPQRKQETKASQGTQAPQDSGVSRALPRSGAVSTATTALQ